MWFHYTREGAVAITFVAISFYWCKALIEHFDRDLEDLTKTPKPLRVAVVIIKWLATPPLLWLTIRAMVPICRAIPGAVW